MAQIGWRRYALAAGILVGSLAVFVVLYVWWPWLIDGARLRRPGLSTQDQAGILAGDRGDVLKIIAGAGAVVALVYTARKHNLDRKAHDLDLKAQELSRQVYALSEQGQVTDRYTKAITQLASERGSERLGGIYALERIMADSARDHPTVVEVLAAFVREHAPLQAKEPEQSVGGKSVISAQQAEPARPRADVQAAMIVLARRPERDEPFTLDLRRTALAGLELPGKARLAGASLVDSDLTGADLKEVTLAGADLGGATLTGADLSGATLAEAYLGGAALTAALLSETNLTKANFFDAMLTRATLSDATLIGAAFSGANLTSANLSRATLTEAHFSQATLTEANLQEATLTRAALAGAVLTKANLSGATLAEANLTAVTLTGANLKDATLTDVIGLTPSQLADALVKGTTKLDDPLASDAWVQARIKACEGVMRRDPCPARTPDPGKPRKFSGA